MEYFKKYFDEVENWNSEEVGGKYIIFSNGIICRNYDKDSLGRPVNKVIKQTKHNGYLVCNINGNIIKIWEDPNEIERTLGFKKNSIQKSINNNYKNSFGFKWSYKEVM